MTSIRAFGYLLLARAAATASASQPEATPGLDLGAACPNLSGKGCSVCVAAIDSRKNSKWGGQPCVHLSKPVRGQDCQPASWWEHSAHPGITATGNCTGCTRGCSGPSPTPPAPAPHPPPPHPKPTRCNNELSIQSFVTALDNAGAEAGVGVAQLVKLPQPKGQEASYPAALDGSPFGFYYLGSNTSTKWTINIQGGGWCE